MLTKDKVSSWVVLIIDDEPDSLEVATRTLKFHGANVLIALNGREAIEVLKIEVPTFILSDLSMPGMDGWALIDQIKSNPHTKDVPVVALTAHALAGDRERALAAGFHYYMTKPLSPLTFLEDLLKLFSEGAAHAVPGNGPQSGLTPPAPAAPPTPPAPPASTGSTPQEPAATPGQAAAPEPTAPPAPAASTPSEAAAPSEQAATADSTAPAASTPSEAAAPPAQAATSDSTANAAPSSDTAKDDQPE